MIKLTRMLDLRSITSCQENVNFLNMITIREIVLLIYDQAQRQVLSIISILEPK